MIEVDRAMMEDYKIELMQMMENAGRNLAQPAQCRCLAGYPRKKRVVILAGTGGNGGGALVCARRPHNFGVARSVGELYLADINVPPALNREAKLNLDVGSIFYRSDILRLG